MGHPRGKHNRYVSSEVCVVVAYGVEVTLPPEPPTLEVTLTPSLTPTDSFVPTESPVVLPPVIEQSDASLTLIYENTFENGPSDRQRFHPLWPRVQIKNGYALRAENEMSVLFPITADLMPLTVSGDFAWQFRAKITQGHLRLFVGRYEIILRPTGLSEVRFEQAVVSEQSTEGWDRQRWHTFRLERQNGQFQVSIDKQVRLSWTDTDFNQPLSIGLQARGLKSGHLLLDNVRVWSTVVLTQAQNIVNPFGIDEFIVFIGQRIVGPRWQSHAMIFDGTNVSDVIVPSTPLIGGGTVGRVGTEKARTDVWQSEAFLSRDGATLAFLCHPQGFTEICLADITDTHSVPRSG